MCPKDTMCPHSPQPVLLVLLSVAATFRSEALGCQRPFILFQLLPPQLPNGRADLAPFSKVQRGLQLGSKTEQGGGFTQGLTEMPIYPGPTHQRALLCTVCTALPHPTCQPVPACTQHNEVVCPALLSVWQHHSTHCLALSS